MSDLECSSYIPIPGKIVEKAVVNKLVLCHEENKNEEKIPWFKKKKKKIMGQIRHPKRILLFILILGSAFAVWSIFGKTLTWPPPKGTISTHCVQSL